MDQLIRKFTFNRSAFKKTPEESAETAAYIIERVRLGYRPDPSANRTDKGLANTIGALAFSMGMLEKNGADWQPTQLAGIFLGLYQQNRADAWRWLTTRSLWRYVVPNGTSAGVNSTATSLNIQFAFFRTWLMVLQHLDTQSGDERFLYYSELCEILDDDTKWTWSADALFNEILRLRTLGVLVPARDRKFLDDLENQYRIRRDNFNGLFNKAFAQTGLFEFKMGSHEEVRGIALSESMDRVMRKRIRFIVDNLPVWNPASETWSAYLTPHAIDLPQEVSALSTSLPPAEVPVEPINGIVGAATADFQAAHFSVSEELTRRFIASLLAKRFLILTGLAGSGKTKLAQAFAAWITLATAHHSDVFKVGTIVFGDKITYTVRAADTVSIELWNTADEATAVKVVIPRALISEWVAAIKEHGLTRDISPRAIRELVGKTTKYATQLNSFESPLKAAAFTAIAQMPNLAVGKFYEVVAVGADWTSNEQIVGYADALDRSRYVRTSALDLILAAHDNLDMPYFLILDEMNLSHVERYFADLLSAIESTEPIRFHNDRDATGKWVARDGVPARLALPPNFFVIGTVNVDETTYMFSPKVLDRANVIEFRVSQDQIRLYLDNPQAINLDGLRSQGVGFARALVTEALNQPSLDTEDMDRLKSELLLFFEMLAKYGVEFGFRTAKETTRFVGFDKLLTETSWDFKTAMDSQVIQKFLPKLHGSRKTLEPVLVALAMLCYLPRDWETDVTTGKVTLKNAEDLKTQAGKAAGLEDETLHPLLARDPNDNNKPTFDVGTALYPLSFEKILRMLRLLDQNGFTSFAEA